MNTNAVLLSSMVLAVESIEIAPPPPLARLMRNVTSVEVNSSAALYLRVKNPVLVLGHLLKQVRVYLAFRKYFVEFRFQPFSDYLEVGIFGHEPVFPRT